MWQAQLEEALRKAHLLLPMPHEQKISYNGPLVHLNWLRLKSQQANTGAAQISAAFVVRCQGQELESVAQAERSRALEAQEMEETSEMEQK